MNLLIHRHTSKQLEQFVASPHHALLLIGPDGIGKTALAEMLAERITQRASLVNYPYFLTVKPGDTGTISIESVRQIQKFLQLKTVGTTPVRRIVVVEHADGLTQEAQNALLKLIEEPPADTVILLTVQNKRSLLPTILSRLQAITVHTPEQSAVTAHFSGHSTDALARAYFLSGGLPGLMHGLLHNEKEQPLLEQVVIAKELLQKPTFERLSMADALAKQRASLGPLLEALVRIADNGVKQTSKQQNTKGLAQWHRIRKEVAQAQNALAQSANSKLVLTKMLLHM